ncbi:MAG: anion transporter [Hyphomicrobiales bacterium]|nr:anion transporter [Hyphomicrobiales bacterium]MCP5370864.1 anion transporter [Hyphomicrobiales bacterium]
MTFDVLTAVAVFAAVYVGMALGRWPGLKIDRSGIALLGAIVLYATGAISGGGALAAIQFPTLVVLFGLMILSAQFAACGFYDWCSARITASRASPAALLGLTVAVAGGLSAVLANDIVVFAMTPMLIAGLSRRGLDPRPYLIALAGGANAGSAATMIGNPQNILIGQVGHLDFWSFAAVCGPPAAFGLVIVFAVVWSVWRRRLRTGAGGETGRDVPTVDRVGVGKAVLATIALLVLFGLPLSQVAGVLAVTGVLLVSRRLATREMFGLVDWHLLVLFAGLFIVTAALDRTGLPRDLVAALASAGIDPTGLPSLVVLALAGSNVIGNVPAVMLLLAVLKDLNPESLYALAVLSTLAGNLLIVGSLANIIVVERAKQSGVVLGFAEHARCGVPMTLCSVVVALAWFVVRGWIGP